MKNKRLVNQFLRRATNSARLAAERFNSPHDEGRAEAVLHFSLHAQEMLSKATLLKRGRGIQERRDSKTISFNRALNLLDASGENVIDGSDKTSLLSLSNLRDAAQHSIVDVSEQELFLHCQAAITIFDRILRSEFDKTLADFFPKRVLPISTDPPESLDVMIDSEISQVTALLSPGKRRTADAKAKLRALLAMDLAAAAEERTATPLEVDRAVKRLKAARPWRDVLPNLASLSLDASGTGQTYSVRLTKDRRAPPVRFAETEDELESAAIIREVDVVQKFPFTITQLAKLAGVTVPKAGALVWKLDIRTDPDSFHVLRLGKSQFALYSHKALRAIRQAIVDLDMARIWADYKARPR